jgi:spore maturation protein CgeB
MARQPTTAASIRALAARGHEIEFFEPDAFERQAAPRHGRPALGPRDGLLAADRRRARGLHAGTEAPADVVIKASGIGRVRRTTWSAAVPGAGSGGAGQTVLLGRGRPGHARPARAANPHDPMPATVGEYDRVLTYGGGPPVIDAYAALGARRCTPIYNAHDPQTHHPVEGDARYWCSLGFLGNRLPDRESRVETFFFTPARLLPARSFLLGGNGWADDESLPPNVRVIGHVYTRDHNIFNASTLAVLNICRDSMASNGYSPATRVFEAAGAGACIISDDWVGIETFLEPGREILVARDGAEVAAAIEGLTPRRAREIGLAARRRVLAGHTYAERAWLVERLLRDEDSSGAGTRRLPAAAGLRGIGR